LLIDLLGRTVLGSVTARPLRLVAASPITLTPHHESVCMTNEPVIAQTAEPTTAQPSMFPADFQWGAGTAAFQIEGGFDADGKSESIWDRFCTVPGAIDDGSDGKVACDHFNRYHSDVALMADLGLGAYRFSIAWPRVIPDGVGAVNPAGLDFYDRLVDELLAAGVAPYATLYHWDLPQILQDKGGWAVRSTAEAFADYAAAVAERLGDRLASIATLNEPFVSASLGYLEGSHAPGRTERAEAYAAAHHLLLAHGLALPRIREIAPSTEAGIVLNFTPVTAFSDSEDDVMKTALVDGWSNRWYVEPLAGKGYPADVVAALGWEQTEIRDGDLELISAPVDFLGINYYSCMVIRAGGEVPPSGPVTDMGWRIEPDGIRRLLVALHAEHGFPRYYITENGAAMPDVADDSGFVDDQDRIDYLRSHLLALEGALEAGVPLAGYFVWSLLDNFEWSFGYEKRFGIVRVDYDTQERIPKASAHWYRDLIQRLSG
jgi:beta-glucosidase